MAKISDVATYYDRLPSDAVEWRFGESRTAECALYADPTGDVPQDLTGATVEAHAEYYLATVATERVQDGATLLTITKMRLQPTPVRDLVVTITDQVSNPGEFTIEFPSDLFAVNPDADEVKDVPVCIVFVVHTIDGERTHQHFPLVCRRGSPS